MGNKKRKIRTKRGAGPDPNHKLRTTKKNVPRNVAKPSVGAIPSVKTAKGRSLCAKLGVVNRKKLRMLRML